MACKCESFEGTESSIEFVDAAFEGVVGRDAGFSSEVDEGEEEVADFVGQVAVVLGFCECVADFVDFFLEFVDDVGGSGPVEGRKPALWCAGRCEYCVACLMPWLAYRVDD